MTISIYKGSILECDVDVIVSPSNSFLHSTVGQNGGLAGVIERAALVPAFSAQTGRYDNTLSKQFQDDCFNLPLIPTGDAKLTRAGALTQFKGIIHAVGPIWGGGNFCELELLYSAYWSSVSLAQRAEFKSIAFPAISAGIFGVPIDVVAKAGVNLARIAKLDVTFALMDDEHVAAFRKHLSA